MKVLITGGLGNLGLWLTEAFLAAGAELHVLGRSEKVHIVHCNYKFIKCNITDKLALLNAVDCYYDVCIHAASYNEHFEQDYSKNALLINALGTEYLCQRLLETGVGKLVYLSTFHVYGSASGFIDENTAILPKNDYGLTHYFAEKYIEKHNRNSNLIYCILRLTNSYGCPKDMLTNKWYLLLNDLARSVVQLKSIKLNSSGQALRDFIWMGDVVKVIQLILDNPSTDNQIFNLSSGQSYKLLDVAQSVQLAYMQHTGVFVDIEVDESDDSKHNELFVSNEKLLSLIQFSPVNMLLEESTNIIKLVEHNL